MKARTIPALVSAIALAGCLATTPPLLNANGQSIEFVSPVLGKDALAGARYVLIEKSIVDEKYQLVSIARIRQPITNARQERIAFTNDLSGFAPDYADASFQTYTDTGNGGEQTLVMNCKYVPAKTEKYSLCNSDFANVFVPVGVGKSYATGQITSVAKKNWEDPEYNKLRYVKSPLSALEQAGVFARLTELTNAN